MFIVQCVLVTLAATHVVVDSTSPTTVPTTAMDMSMSTTTETATTTSSRSTQESTIADDDIMTTDQAVGSTTSFTADLSSTSAEINATTATPEVTHGNINAPLLTINGFEFNTLWTVVLAAGGFTLLTVLPLLIIMILIVALGCMCKKYKRLQKRLTMQQETVASSNHTATEMTTAMNNSDVVLRNIVILDGIDTGTNVAYGRTSTIVESCDIRKNAMTTENATEADEQINETNDDIVMTGDNVAYSMMSEVVEGATGPGADDNETVVQDDTGEDDGEEDYVINDMYASID